MAEPEVKAAGFNSLVQAIRKVAGDAAFQRLLPALSPEARALIEKPALPVTWLPARRALEVDEVAARVLFDGDAERMVAVGREQLRQDLGTVYRVFIRVASPHYVAERAAQIYQTYVKNNGTMRVSNRGDKWVELALEDIATPSATYYALRRGNVLGAIDATGAKNARCEVTEGGGREPRCILRASWG